MLVSSQVGLSVRLWSMILPNKNRRLFLSTRRQAIVQRVSLQRGFLVENHHIHHSYCRLILNNFTCKLLISPWKLGIGNKNLIITFPRCLPSASSKLLFLQIDCIHLSCMSFFKSFHLCNLFFFESFHLFGLFCLEISCVYCSVFL